MKKIKTIIFADIPKLKLKLCLSLTDNIYYRYCVSKKSDLETKSWLYKTIEDGILRFDNEINI